MIHSRFELDHHAGEGWLAPWIEGLRDRRAVGARCTICQKVTFPPERTCCGTSGSLDWFTLSGLADILFRTEGADGSFALVRLDGAANAALVRLVAVPDAETRCRLVGKPGTSALVFGPVQKVV